MTKNVHKTLPGGGGGGVGRGGQGGWGQGCLRGVSRCHSIDWLHYYTLCKFAFWCPFENVTQVMKIYSSLRNFSRYPSFINMLLFLFYRRGHVRSLPRVLHPIVERDISGRLIRIGRRRSFHLSPHISKS